MRSPHSLLLAAAITCAAAAPALADFKLPRASQNATVTQTIGITDLSIKYSRPGVKGREIWGKLVPYGLTDLGFGNGKPDPWRAGANENTVFEVSNDVTIEGKALPAGRYGLHMIAGPDEWLSLIHI